MASRADMIRSARRRVDARRDARRADINRSAAIKRYSTTPIKSSSFTNRKYNQQGGKRWDQKLGDWIKDKASKTGEGIMGPYHAMAKAGKEIFIDPIRKASENKKILGDVLTDNLRESVMTEKNKEFYKKYMRLADIAPNADKRREYINTANTALRNAQISSRINYGLGTLGYDTIGKEPFESYLPDFTGGEGTGFEEGASPRFNLVNFLDAFRGTKAGKDFYYGAPGIGGTKAGNEFYNAALAAQAGESGNTMMSNAMKNYGKSPEEIADYKLRLNSMGFPDTMSDNNKMYYAANPEKYYENFSFGQRTGQSAPVAYSDPWSDPWMHTQNAIMAGMMPYYDTEEEE